MVIMPAVKMPGYISEMNYPDLQSFETALVRAWVDYATASMERGSKHLLVLLDKSYLDYWAAIIDEVTETGWVLRDKEWDISDGDWYGMFRLPNASVPDFAGRIETESGALVAELREKAERVAGEREQRANFD
jgi:hypothetical protein